MLDSRQPVAQLVLDHSECAPVFQRHGIDFCCRGELSVADACARVGASPERVLSELSRAIETRAPGARGPDPRSLSTPALIAHIVETHHHFLRNALPFVQVLAAKVGRVHGDRNPRLRELHAVVEALCAALLPHLDAEEQSLFPRLLADEPATESLRAALFDMQSEHLELGEVLARLRAATEDYRLPDWACNSYRALFGELLELERDVLTHIHLENHVLAPRVAPP